MFHFVSPGGWEGGGISYDSGHGTNVGRYTFPIAWLQLRTSIITIRVTMKHGRWINPSVAWLSYDMPPSTLA